VIGDDDPLFAASRRRMNKPTIIMVHGAFCGGWTFEAFRRPFEAAGHTVLAPDLRGHAAGSRSEAVIGLSIGDYAAQIAELIAAQPTPPVLLGHSLGGLVAQIAAARAPIKSLILLAPSPPWGIQGGSVEEAVSAVTLYALGPYWAQAIEPDYASARLYSLNRLDAAARKDVFARMSAESGRALWETLNWWLDPFMTTSVSPGRIKAPTLAVVGDKDLIHPPSTVGQTAARLNGTVKVMPGMSHWLPGEPGWEEVAAACLEWLGALAPVG
jgi:pimeloyl-ACP methyl ester carboxylesterase